MSRFSRRKSAGNVLLARMPPTFAAARNAYSGRSRWKKLSTAACNVRSSSARVRVIRFTYPPAVSRRRIADPTSPVCPATNTRLVLSIRGPPDERVAGVSKRLFLPGEFQVVVPHHLPEFLEGDFGPPAQAFPAPP